MFDLGGMSNTFFGQGKGTRTENRHGQTLHGCKTKKNMFKSNNEIVFEYLLVLCWRYL